MQLYKGLQGYTTRALSGFIAVLGFRGFAVLLLGVLEFRVLEFRVQGLGFRVFEPLSLLVLGGNLVA